MAQASRRLEDTLEVAHDLLTILGFVAWLSIFCLNKFMGVGVFGVLEHGVAIGLASKIPKLYIHTHGLKPKTLAPETPLWFEI